MSDNMYGILLDSAQLDADLTSVASAIRGKTGDSAQLAFPSGFVNAIGSMPSSGDIPNPSDATPQALGTAAAGSSSDYSRADHVHAMPTAADVGAEPAVTEVTVSTAGAVAQALDAGKIYHFTSELTSLTLTFNAPASGDLAQYHFIFSTGSTAPTLTLPSGVTMPDDWDVEADKRYEVDILDGYGVAVSWAVSV